MGAWLLVVGLLTWRLGSSSGAIRVIKPSSSNAPHASVGDGATGLKVPFEKLTVSQRVDICESQYSELYSAIHDDLRPWRANGISAELMQATIFRHTTRAAGSLRKGFAAGFRNGTAVLPDKPRLKRDLAHHAALFTLYMRVLLDASELFGALIPDQDFVISTTDRPTLMAYNTSQTAPQPVMRFCKSSSHSDILVPNFHFYSSGHSQAQDRLPENTNARYPWSSRKPVLFGRFVMYLRHMHPNDPYTDRKGANGTVICVNDTTSVKACRVRDHFVEWSKQHAPLIDVDSHPKIPMHQHAQYKYLLHLDGQGLSSRLEQLLPLGSLVFKEESGYRAFYHHLLQPYKHYLPVWKQVPEDTLTALAWARDNDRAAAAIAAAGQQVAANFLSREARACYWYKLLVGYGSLMRYRPTEYAQKAPMSYNKPIKDYLEELARDRKHSSFIHRYTFRTQA